MTAPLATSTNTYTGLREIGQVTNTYAGYLQSAGSAYNLLLPWQADKFEWWNYTKFASAGNNVRGVWFRDFPAGDALIDNFSGGSAWVPTLEATNGITIANVAGGFAALQHVITGITTATPAVVTSAGHGFSDGDRVVITKVIGTMAQEVNNNTYVVDVLGVNTFALYDTFGVPVTTVGAYGSSGQATLAGPSLGIVAAPAQYYLTLGTAVIGADNDIIYFVATKFNAFFNLGDVTP